MLRRICLLGVLAAAAALAQRGVAQQCDNWSDLNAVVHWNDVANQSIAVTGGKSPQLGSIDAAIVHVAIFDAVNAACGSPYNAYASTPMVRFPAMAEAAAAAAAHDTLAALYPAQRQSLDQQYGAFLDQIQGHRAAVINGVVAGQQAAYAVLLLRANDGRNAATPWTPPTRGPGAWEPTPPGFLAAATPWVRAVTPWTMSSPSQFRAPAPPSLDSAVWVHDYQETKALGAAVGSSRTPEQTDLALFIGGAGVHPMMQWHAAWRGIATDRTLSTLESARLFAMLTTAGSDALIACWDSKFNYGFWRPVTAIRAGGGNPALTPDGSWIGIAVTPNHPEYPAAHGCLSGSVIETLRQYFGTDNFQFTMSSAAPGLSQPVRSYTRFSQALQDILDARIYGGMHYRNSTVVGAGMGTQIAQQAAERYFTPRH
jgi:hypothetical protein